MTVSGQNNEIWPFMKRKQVSANMTTSYNVQNLFSFPSDYVWGTLVIVQIFDLGFLTDLHNLGSGESKNTKLALCPGVC